MYSAILVQPSGHNALSIFGTMPGSHNVLNKFGTLLGIDAVTLYFIILAFIMLNPDKMSSVQSKLGTSLILHLIPKIQNRKGKITF